MSAVNPVNIEPYKSGQRKNVAFTGINPVVGLMDVIDKGGYAASFILQDGIGFVAPRVGKGILRGGKEKTDEHGNVIYDRNGNPKHEYNWEYARKEGIREVVTGPSAFLIPLALITVIKKFFGRGNNVKLNYIDGLSKPLGDFIKADTSVLTAKEVNKSGFYERVFKDVIDNSINGVEGADKLSEEEVKTLARQFAEKQVTIDKINADKSLSKKVRKAKLAEVGSVEDAFMKLRKSKIGGVVDQAGIRIKSSNGTIKGGSIGELITSMNDYFSDAMHNAKKVLKGEVSAAQVEEFAAKFAKHRMGTRLFTNFGLFAAVVAFYTQIPKLYNLGLKTNPALKGTQAETTDNTTKSKDVAFTGGIGTLAGKAGEKVFNNKTAKAVSDMFELNGAVIPGTAMPVLLYGFCIPPRLKHAQDKYDYGEIALRDFTSFTALLFGAKALARLFSDGFTRLTGLALNRKNLEGRSAFKKVFDYLNPNNTRHSVLSTKELTASYTNIQDYKGGVNGFVEFIEKSGGNIKKAFSLDKDVQACVEEIVGKSIKEASVDNIKEALRTADKNKTDAIKKFYKLFEKENGLLSKAKTCNSAFGFLSTLVLVPGFIMWLTGVCERMTKKRIDQDFVETKSKYINQAAREWLRTNTPTMAGFLNRSGN